MATVITICNQKGGTGKTTTAVNLSACLVRKGRRVLLLDLDPQANATTHLGLDPFDARPTIYEILRNNKTIEEVMLAAVGGINLVPANLFLAELDLELIGEINRENRLRKAIESVHNNYDYIFIDCPPNLGIATINAFCACDVLVIPIQTNFFAIDAVARLLLTLQKVVREYRYDIQIYALATMFEKHTNVQKQVLAQIRKKFEAQMLTTVIHKNTKLVEASSAGMPITEYDQTSSGFFDYVKLAKEIIGEIEEAEQEQKAGLRR